MSIIIQWEILSLAHRALIFEDAALEMGISRILG